MKFTEAVSYVRFKTETDSTSFTDAQILLLFNIYKNEISQEIAKVNEDIFGIPQTRSLVAGQREYDFPTNTLNNLKMLEVKLTEGGEWRRVQEFDLNNYRASTRVADNPLNMNIGSGEFSRATTDETTILANFTDSMPMYDIFRNSIFLYTGSTIEDVEQGLKLWMIAYPDDWTSAQRASSAEMAENPSASTSGFPKQFHKLLCQKVVWDYKYRDGQIPANEYNQYKIDFKESMDAMRGTNMDREIISTMPYNDGSQY